MYTDEEVLYHAFKISQTRDDQLMHAGKSRSYKDKNESVYKTPAGPKTLATTPSKWLGKSKADVMNLTDNSRTFLDSQYIDLVNHELDRIPSHIDKLFSDLSTNRNNSQINDAEKRLLYSYAEKIKQKCDKTFNSLYGEQNNNVSKMRRLGPKTLDVTPTDMLIRQTIANKYRIPEDIVVSNVI